MQSYSNVDRNASNRQLVRDDCFELQVTPSIRAAQGLNPNADIFELKSESDADSESLLSWDRHSHADYELPLEQEGKSFCNTHFSHNDRYKH